MCPNEQCNSKDNKDDHRCDSSMVDLNDSICKRLAAIENHHSPESAQDVVLVDIQLAHQVTNRNRKERLLLPGPPACRLGHSDQLSPQPPLNWRQWHHILGNADMSVNQLCNRPNVAAVFSRDHSSTCDFWPCGCHTGSRHEHSPPHCSIKSSRASARQTAFQCHSSSSENVPPPSAATLQAEVRNSPTSRQLLLARLILLCTAFSLLNGVDGLQITQYLIPRMVDATNTTQVTLDCKYKLDPADLKLVVRWFHNDSPEAIYQWIPEPDTRYIGELIRPYFDMNFSVSYDRFSKYRALRLNGPLPPSLSGNYSCVISSIASQESRQGQMVVYVPPHNASQFVFQFIELNRDQIALECLVRGVYPRPVLTFSEHRTNHPFYHRFPPVNVSVSYQAEIDRYGASFLHPMRNALSAGTVYECRLELPGTYYARKKRIKIIFPTNYAANPVDKSFSMSFSDGHRTRAAHWATVLLAALTAAIVTASTSSLHLLANC